MLTRMRRHGVTIAGNSSADDFETIGLLRRNPKRTHGSRNRLEYQF
jgi:hypothetical protein